MSRRYFLLQMTGWLFWRSKSLRLGEGNLWERPPVQGIPGWKTLERMLWSSYDLRTFFVDLVNSLKQRLTSDRLEATGGGSFKPYHLHWKSATCVPPAKDEELPPYAELLGDQHLEAICAVPQWSCSHFLRILARGKSQVYTRCMYIRYTYIYIYYTRIIVCIHIFTPRLIWHYNICIICV